MFPLSEIVVETAFVAECTVAEAEEMTTLENVLDSYVTLAAPAQVDTYPPFSRIDSAVPPEWTAMYAPAPTVALLAVTP